MTVFFKPKGQDAHQEVFYSFLSTEKAQDGNVVYTNTRIMLEDIIHHLDHGDEVVRIGNGKALLEILDDTDGCAVQYRCANALYMLQKLAIELDIIYDRGIDAEGHGKKKIDGYSGVVTTNSVAMWCISRMP